MTKPYRVIRYEPSATGKSYLLESIALPESAGPNVIDLIAQSSRLPAHSRRRSRLTPSPRRSGTHPPLRSSPSTSVPCLWSRPGCRIERHGRWRRVRRSAQVTVWFIACAIFSTGIGHCRLRASTVTSAIVFLLVLATRLYEQADGCFLHEADRRAGADGRREGRRSCRRW